MSDNNQTLLIEKAVLFYASIGKIRTDNNQYPYFMRGYDVEQIIDSLVDRDLLLLGTAEESIKLFPYKELQKYLSNRGIKPGNKKSVVIERVLENFDVNKVASDFGYLCYIPTSKGMSLIKGYNINDFYFGDIHQVNEDGFLKEKHNSYLENNKDIKINIENDNNTIIVKKGRELLSRVNKFDIVRNVHIYSGDELQKRYSNICAIFYLVNTGVILLVGRSNESYIYYPYNYVKQTQEKPITSLVNYVSAWNIASDDCIDNSIINKVSNESEDDIYYYISSDEVTKKMFSELWCNYYGRVQFDDSKKIFADENDNNYIISVNKKDTEMREFIMYLFKSSIISYPRIMGVKVFDIYSMYKVNAHSDEVYKYTIAEYNASREMAYCAFNTLKNKNLTNINAFVEKMSEVYPLNVICEGNYKYYIAPNKPFAKDKSFLGMISKENKYEMLYKDILLEMREKGIIPSRWKNEFELYLLIKRNYDDAVFQYHSEWLGLQSLDIYIPSIRIGVEYQGIQHYEAIEIFDGKDGLQRRKILDAQKRKLCNENKVKLLEWKYNNKVNFENVRVFLQQNIYESNYSF